MYKSKYQKYITKSESRFAEPSEIISASKTAFDKGKAAGVPLYYNGRKLFVDNEDNHSLIIGATGSKKSRVTAFATTASVIEAGESAVINDPKGEIYKKTAARAKELGADVILLNFRKPSQSCGWNPFTQAKRFFDRGMVEEGQQCVNDLAESMVAPALERTADTYWGTSAKSFVNGLTLMLMDSVTEEYFNIKTLIPFCYESAQHILKRMVTHMDPTSTAAFGIKTVVDLEAEKTKSCIYGMLLTIMQSLVQNPHLLDMLCDNNIDIEEIGRKQTIVYVVYPDEKENLNFLVNLFLTQCYETLVSVAAEEIDDRLPVRVNFILDEFSNLTAINNFDNRISECRSKNIRYFLFIQSFAQLKNKYGENAETIITNCNNWVCFTSKDMEFLEKVSKICGSEVDYNGKEHYLISPFDMQHLEKRKESSEVLIVKQGQYPFITNLPDFDYIDISEKYERSDITKASFERKIVCITPDEWIERISDGSFKIPYPDKVRTA